MDILKSAKDPGPVLIGIKGIHRLFCQALFCEEFGCVFQKAVVGGVALKGRMQFDADDGYSGVSAFQIDDVPDEAYFLRAEEG